jgi:glycosyltransferase involved in cell wall biosynthesis
VEYEILDRLAEREPRAVYRMLLRREAAHFRRFELKLMDQVDEVRTITTRDAETFLAAGVDNRVRPLNAFIDVDNYQRDPELEIEKHSIVHVGNMAWLPNCNGINWFLREVWPDVLRRYPDSRFYIVGKNPSPSIQRLGGDNIIVTGYVDDEKPFIQRAHLFIVPLFEGSGVRIKILTAMAMGKVSLSTPIGAEGIDWPGLIIRDTAEAWIAAIREQFEGTATYSEDAIQYIRDHYDWRRTLRLEDEKNPNGP